MENFCKRLGIEAKAELLPFYEQGKILLKKHKDKIVDISRLSALNEKYKFLRKWFSDICEAARLVAQDEDLLLFTYVLYSIISANNELYKMEMPNRNRMDTDFAPLFSLMFCIEDMTREMEARGLPFDVISDTLQGFDAEINDYYDMFGRSGMRIYVEWFMLFVNLKLVRIGRFNFEMTEFPEKVRVYEKDDDIKILIDGQFMNKKGMVFGSKGQNDENDKFFAEIEENGDSITGYPVNEYGEVLCEKVTLCGYREALKHGDKILNVHIPAHEPLSHELCVKSYERAREIFAKYYPEYDYKAFCCFSWMLEKRLRDIVEGGNVLAFANDYSAIPLLNDGSEVYTFLFHLEKPIENNLLPEKSSMQRAVKKYLCDGNYFYQKGGVFLK